MFPTNLLPGPASDGGNPPAPVVPPSRPASRRPASAAFPAAPFREASREPASIATLPAPPESAIMPPEPREPPAPVEAPPVFIDPPAKRPPVPAPGDAPPEEVAPPPSSDDPQAASVSVATRSEADFGERAPAAVHGLDHAKRTLRPLPTVSTAWQWRRRRRSVKKNGISRKAHVSVVAAGEVR